MQNTMIDNLNDQTRQLFEPMRKLNSLMLSNMQRMTEYQMESMQRYSQMGTERMRDAAAQLSDKPAMSEQGVKALSARQAEVMSELSQQLMEDANAFSEMNLQFKSELETLFLEQVKVFEQLASAANDEASVPVEQVKPAAQSSSKPSSSNKKSR
ncbi:phasin family protein [Halomonas halocynthiae]|uniref:phasin family protein n=1 Tax=Halomonas halocynthiae TaxID=176290 RepID=UPI0003F70742|nr:phasin family protein [Halomonas halocynthiae]